MTDNKWGSSLVCKDVHRFNAMATHLLRIRLTGDQSTLYERLPDAMSLVNMKRLPIGRDLIR